MLALNQVMLVGTLPEEPTLTYPEYGTPPYSFTLPIGEHGQAHTFRLYVLRPLGDLVENVAEGISAADPRGPALS